MNERIRELALQAGFDDFPNDENGIWITDGYWDEQLERFYEMAFEAGRMYGIQQSPAEPVSQVEVKMNEKEINEAFDREYEQYKNSPEHKHEFVKLKMPTYYIAKHSDEDLRAAVLKEREACAKVCDAKADEHGWEGNYAYQCAAAIRGRTE